jgi:hypothetical protein
LVHPTLEKGEVMARTFATPVADAIVEHRRGTWVNQEGDVSHGRGAHGEIPVTSNINHIDPVDRYAHAMNLIRQSADEPIALTDDEAAAVNEILLELRT